MKWSESVISDKGFMTVRHLILQGTNYDIGKKLAEIAIERHNFSKETVTNSDLGITRARCTYFARNYPILLERARGVAAALKIDPTDCITEIPYNQEVPFGCSVVYYPPAITESGDGCVSRNYDFPIGTLPDIMGIPLPSEPGDQLNPVMGDPYILEIHPDNGYSSLCLTSFELLSGVLDGINSEGLVVAVNGDETAVMDPSIMVSGQPKVGLHELQGMRLLLDTCATVKEAKETLLVNKHFHSFVPCHYLIADQEGNLFVYEYSNHTEYIINGSTPFVVTNHPLHQFPSADDLPEQISTLETGTSSFERYKTLIEIIKSEDPPYTIDFMKKANAEVSASKVVSWIPDSEREQFAASPGLARTLWHCIYSSTARKLDIKFYVGDEPAEKGNFTEQYTKYYQFSLE